jgi:hypothetical protein
MEYGTITQLYFVRLKIWKEWKTLKIYAEWQVVSDAGYISRIVKRNLSIFP